jgi:hypothetical protein
MDGDQVLPELFMLPVGDPGLVMDGDEVLPELFMLPVGDPGLVVDGDQVLPELFMLPVGDPGLVMDGDQVLPELFMLPVGDLCNRGRLGDRVGGSCPCCAFVPPAGEERDAERSGDDRVAGSCCSHGVDRAPRRYRIGLRPVWVRYGWR